MRTLGLAPALAGNYVWDATLSETVVPPGVARNLPLNHTNVVGTEYEVANGGVVVNLGEKRAGIVTKLGSKTSMIMSLRVVKVHKPPLAVSWLVEPVTRCTSTSLSLTSCSFCVRKFL